jgi:hypothetical protein
MHNTITNLENKGAFELVDRFSVPAGLIPVPDTWAQRIKRFPDRVLLATTHGWTFRQVDFTLALVYEHRCKGMTKLGFVASKSDPCLFLHKEHKIIVLDYCDDQIWLSPNNALIETYVDQIWSSPDNALIETYVQKLKDEGYDLTLIDTIELTPTGLITKIIEFTGISVAHFHGQAVKRIVRYLLETSVKGLIFKPDPVSVKSHTGFVLTLFECPVLWSGKLPTYINLSSTAAEYVTFNMAMHTLLPMRALLQAPRIHLDSPFISESLVRSTVFENDLGVISLLTTPKMSPRNKYLALSDIFFWDGKMISDDYFFSLTARECAGISQATETVCNHLDLSRRLTDLQYPLNSSVPPSKSLSATQAARSIKSIRAHILAKFPLHHLNGLHSSDGWLTDPLI